MLKEVSKPNEVEHDPSPVAKGLQCHAQTHRIGIIQRSKSPTRYLVWMRVYQPPLSRKADSTRLLDAGIGQKESLPRIRIE